jgi:hypothetical protein
LLIVSYATKTDARTTVGLGVYVAA